LALHAQIGKAAPLADAVNLCQDPNGIQLAALLTG